MKVIRCFSLLLLLSLCIMIIQTGAAAEQKSYPRWLAIGNSITQHGPRPDLEWTGEPRGMAASAVDRDYVHVLQDMIRKKDPASAVEVKIAGRLGRLSGGTIEQMTSVLDELRAWRPDLVTIQLGENDSLSELGEQGFESRYRTVVDAFLSAEKPPLVVCTGVWSPDAPVDQRKERYKEGSEVAIKEQIIEKICREKGLEFVSLAGVASQRSNFGDGESAGVRWHPNDNGMKGYARLIFDALCAR